MVEIKDTVAEVQIIYLKCAPIPYVNMLEKVSLDHLSREICEESEDST